MPPMRMLCSFDEPSARGLFVGERGSEHTPCAFVFPPTCCMRRCLGASVCACFSSHPGLRADARAFHLRAFGDTAARDVCPVRRPVGASFFLIPYAIELQPVGPATSYCDHLPMTDSRPKPRFKDGVLRKRTRVGNFLTCPSLERIAWVWIAVIPAI